MDFKQIIISPGSKLQFDIKYDNKFPIEITIEEGENVKHVVITSKLPTENFDHGEARKVIEKIKFELESKECDPDLLLLEACEKNNMECIKLLIRCGANVSCIIDKKTIMEVLLENSNYEIAKFFIENGFKFKYKNSYFSFLNKLLMTEKIDLKFMEILSPNLKDVNVNFAGKMDFYKNKTKEELKKILDFFDINTPRRISILKLLCMCFDERNFLLLEVVVEKYDKILKTCFCEFHIGGVGECKTPLTMACLLNNYELTKYLLEKGAITYFPHDKNKNILNIYLRFTKTYNKELILLLIDYGVNINHIQENKSILLNVICEGNIEIVKLLVSKGYKIHHGDIHFAFYHMDILWFFLKECDFDINQIISKKRTCLILAAASGHIDVVEYLLEKNADIHIKDCHNKTFVDYLSEENKLRLGPLIYPGSKIKKVKICDI